MNAAIKLVRGAGGTGATGGTSNAIAFAEEAKLKPAVTYKRGNLPIQNAQALKSPYFI
jgi:hypothetical protein